MSLLSTCENNDDDESSNSSSLQGSVNNNKVSINDICLNKLSCQERDLEKEELCKDETQIKKELLNKDVNIEYQLDIPDNTTEFSFHLYKQRWLILVSYCLLTLSAGSAWLCFPAVSNIVQAYYSIGILSVNMLSIIFGIAIIVVSIPFAIILETYGLSVTLKLAAVLNLLGAIIRSFGYNDETGYWFLLVGNVFTAMSVAGFLFLPGKIAATWFGENEIGKATAICIASDAIGSGVGFLHAASVIRNHTDKELTKTDIKYFLISQSVVATVVFIFVMIFTKKQPATPPSFAELEHRQLEEMHNLLKVKRCQKRKSKKGKKGFKLKKLKNSLWELLKNRDFQLIIHMQGIVASIEGIYEMLLNEMLIELYPGYEQSIGVVGFVSVIFGFLTNIIVGALIDKTQSSKIVSLLIFILTTISCIIWTIFIEFRFSFILLAIAYCTLMSISTSYYTVAFAHSANIALTSSSAAVGVLLILTSQIFDTICSFTITEILEYFGSIGVNCTGIVISFLAVFLALCVRDKAKEDEEDIPIKV